MIINIQREVLLNPLTKVVSVIANKNTLEILSNFCFTAKDGAITIIGSDSEVEIMSKCDVEKVQDGSITIPARKLFNIVKALPSGAMINLTVKDNNCIVKSGKSKFKLLTLSSLEFPLANQDENYSKYQIQSNHLNKLISQTSFCMAVQDVRYFLNGLLFDINGDNVNCVAADGHRLALSESSIINVDSVDNKVIVPRKGVIEIQKLLQNSDSMVDIMIGKNHINVICEDVSITSKLIDGNFPDYESVIPKEMEKTILVEKSILKSSLQRVSILSNAIFKGVKLEIDNSQIKISGANTEDEKAEDIILIESDIEISTGFNVTYLLDAINVIDSNDVKLCFKDEMSSCLVKQSDDDSCRLVVMPIRL